MGKVWLRKKSVNLCDNEEHEHGVGAGVNTTLLSDNYSQYVSPNLPESKLWWFSLSMDKKR